jgi:hypothetical protein
MERKLYTMTQVRTELGLSHATVLKYMRRLGIKPMDGGLDWRERYVTQADLDRLKAVINDKTLLVKARSDELPT